MKRKQTLLALIILLAVAQPILADPCGMVPPIMVMAGSPAIERIGLQKTYVFYKNGVETFVIRPGYRGSIDNFGMLIPFPTPPAIRKVPDNIFAHVTAAVDPPEVLVDLRWQARGVRMLNQAMPKSAAQESDLAYKRSEVRVISEEAVGMYEVAVLEAGSAAALRGWMDEHGYKYPDGMDSVCEDYVDDGWCFVAVKTKIGQKAGVNPHPGQREVNSTLPAGSTFDGNVQAMGFRFHSDEFVLPMRLSAFNAGELHNIVYILTDRPQRIRGIPSDYVVRQITGKELYRNLTAPLPVRVLGGNYEDIAEAQLKALEVQRDPTPHNSRALELFASDLRTSRTGKLSHEFEELEKELLRIGERLGLRGEELDIYHHEALAEAREIALRGALKDIKRMTLTVVDGDFSRDVLARDNLHFTTFAMRTRDNQPSSYDAKEFGPAPQRGGKLYDTGSTDHRGMWRVLFPVAGALLLGLVTVGSRRIPKTSDNSRLSTCVVVTTVGVLVLGSLGASAHTRASYWIEQLDNNELAPEAVETLVALGDDAVGPLLREAAKGDDLATRGWAIVCLSEIGGERAARGLEKISEGGSQQNLVRAWAGAARVPLARTGRDFRELVQLTQQLTPVARPLGQRLARAGGASAETLVEMSLRHPKLQPSLSDAIVSLGGLRLIDAMLTADENFVRRGAAGYVGGLAIKGGNDVPGEVVHALRYRRNATAVPWNGGALFVPGLSWSRDDARELGDNLMKWLIFCTRQGLSEEAQQIMNNLRSPQLMEVAGYTWPRTHNAEGWMWVWGKMFGRGELKAMIVEQGATNDQPFRRILSEL